MPIFELETGRPTVLQPMQPAAGTFDTDSRALVTRHLVSLLGEPLFPVSAGAPGSDRPHLLAVDAAGQPVVVEVVQVLDSAALTRSLRLAGTAARMSSVDLARAYRSGPDEFATDLVAFRETVPVARAHAAARHGGARLFVLCSEVAEDVVDAVEFLRGPGRRLEVLQLGVLRGADGRRYAEVSPLAPSLPTRRPVEPSSLRAMPPTGALPVLTGAAVPSPRDEPSAGSDRERVVGALAPGGTFPSVLPVPVGPVPAEPVDQPAPEPEPEPEPDPEPEPAPESEAEPVPEPESEPEAQEESDEAAADQTEPAVQTEPAAQTEPAVQTEPAAQPEPAQPEPDHPEHKRHEADRPGPGTSPADTPDDTATEAEQQPIPALVALAARLGGTATLVWNRLRRGQRFVVELRGDGLLELPDGTVVADPDVAATVLADAESPLDGWRAWHVGDDGPPLREAAGR
jgi:hypothetical protein